TRSKRDWSSDVCSSDLLDIALDVWGSPTRTMTNDRWRVLVAMRCLCSHKPTGSSHSFPSLACGFVRRVGARYLKDFQIIRCQGSCFDQVPRSFNSSQ